MNNNPINSNRAPDSFTEGVEQLYDELELSVMWQRPSYLFAIYRSETIRKDAEELLSNRIAALKQKISTILLDDVEDLKSLPTLFQSPAAQETIFFVRGMIWDCSQSSVQLYQEIKKYQELIPDYSIRVVFWIMEKEISNLIACAPEYWNFRHRAVDFTDTPQETIETRIEPILENHPPSPQVDKPAVSVEAVPQKVAAFEAPVIRHDDPDDKVTENANMLLTMGISEWRKINYEKAQEYILVALETSKILHDQGLKARCYHALALVKTGLRRYEDAIDAYQQAVALAPDQIFPWDNLGQLFCKLDRHQEAIKAYEKAIEHNPEDPFGWNGLGNAYAEIGLAQNAVAAYQKAIKISPDFANAYIGQGDVYASQGAWNEAIASYQQATKINPRLLKPWVNLGNVLQKKDQYERAIHAYRNALTVDPSIVNVWNELGNAYLRINACEEAMEAYQKVIELNPGFGWPYANLAHAHFMKGDYSKAVELFEKSIELLDNDSAKAVSWNKLGDAHRQLHNYDQALVAYQTADLLTNVKVKKPERKSFCPVKKVEEASNKPMVDIKITPSNNTQNNDISASVASEVIVQREPAQKEEADIKSEAIETIQDANHWNLMGNTYLRAGSFDEAIAAYKKAIELSPDSVWAYLNNLTLAYYKKGQEKGNSSSDFQGYPRAGGRNDNSPAERTFSLGEDANPEVFSVSPSLIFDDAQAMPAPKA